MAHTGRAILSIATALDMHGVPSEIPHRLPGSDPDSVVLSFAHVDDADGAEEILAPCSHYVRTWLRMDALHVRVYLTGHR
jgi:hypothetical protein